MTIHEEATLFKVGLTGTEDLQIFARRRVSYKAKSGKAVVNKRIYKTCGICGKDQKQLSKHIKTVHSEVSSKLR